MAYGSSDSSQRVFMPGSPKGAACEAAEESTTPGALPLGPLLLAPSALGSSSCSGGGAVGSSIEPIQRDATRPTPSIMARMTAPSTADPAMTFGPDRMASRAPVAPPETIELMGSSFFLMATRQQSMVENMPPQAANWEAVRGARTRTSRRAPSILCPWAALLNPPTPWKMPPPTRPIENADPMSSPMRNGQGSLVYSSIATCGEVV
ncbi:hypothetical protein PENTCL1PPCAC_19971, partial [Pristionchus entomophagus]